MKQTQQAEERLEEIRRLLMERERRSRELSEIDAQISELAGIEKESRPTHRKPLSRDAFKQLCGVQA